MASLKSFLYAVAPDLGVTPAALYERQRALVALGALPVTPGRGPGSGVPLSSENIAAVIISLLAAETLADVDQRVLAICNAKPNILVHNNLARWKALGKPTFQTEVARVLSGEMPKWQETRRNILGIRVTRCWRAEITHGKGSKQSIYYFSEGNPGNQKISITAEIDDEMLSQLITVTRVALRQNEYGEQE
jgi:hypothetical protein